MEQPHNKQVEDEKVKGMLNFQDKEVKHVLSVDKFKPIQDYLLILIPKIEKKTVTGILKSQRQVDEELKELPQVFEVVAVGERVDTKIVNVGQYVLCTRVNQVPVESNKEGFEVAIVRILDVIGVTEVV